jgi:hypothetical protein
VNCTDDANTIGRLAERKRLEAARVVIYCSALPSCERFLPKIRAIMVAFTLMKFAPEAPLGVTTGRRTITTDMVKARIKGHP